MTFVALGLKFFFGKEVRQHQTNERKARNTHFSSIGHVNRR